MAYISVPDYGQYLEQVADQDYAECLKCQHRFVGGDIDSRRRRYLVHAERGCEWRPRAAPQAWFFEGPPVL